MVVNHFVMQERDICQLRGVHMLNILVRLGNVFYIKISIQLLEMAEPLEYHAVKRFSETSHIMNLMESAS